MEADDGLDAYHLKNDLEKEGFSIKVLNVQGEPMEIVERAAALYGEEAQRQAVRVHRDDEVRLAQVETSPKPESMNILTLLGIRHPVEDAVYCFAATAGAEITQDVVERLGCINPVKISDRMEDIKGLYHLDTQRLSDLLLVTAPSAIALCGDSAAALLFVHQVLKEKPALSSCKSFRRNALLPLPWYCRPMGWRLPRVLEIWQRAIKELTGL